MNKSIHSTVSFNSIIVRLKFNSYALQSEESRLFQFYYSAIKIIPSPDKSVIGDVFQFYYSAIKIMKKRIK